MHSKINFINFQLNVDVMQVNLFCKLYSVFLLAPCAIKRGELFFCGYNRFCLFYTRLVKSEETVIYTAAYKLTEYPVDIILTEWQAGIYVFF